MGCQISGMSDKWSVKQVGCQISGVSDKWGVRQVEFQTSGVSCKWGIRKKNPDLRQVNVSLTFSQ